MTNKEAIDIIANYEIYGCGYCHQGGDEIPEAFKKAIDVLKMQQEPRLITRHDNSGNPLPTDMTKRAEWLEGCAANRHDDIFCSNCDKDATYFVDSSDGIHWSRETPKYCPNCGAKMDGERRDDNESP